MNLKCKLFGHDRTEAFWMDLDAGEHLPTRKCERCDHSVVDIQRYIDTGTDRGDGQ